MIYTFDDSESLAQYAANEIAKSAQLSMAERGRFDLVLAGGKTPNRTYEILAEAGSGSRLWENTHFSWADERCVPPDDVESNYHSARLCLLDPLKIPPGHIHRIPAEDADPSEAAERYGTIFPQRPDLLLLGMGDDGHTASLFPGSPALDETRRRFVVSQAPVEPRLRITATPPTIAAARTILVLVCGKNKADAVRRVFSREGDIHETPARLVRGAIWLVDKSAAKELSGIIR
jgi:6-phosphogluconolactonase